MLAVDVRPWAEVWVDGKKVGHTPMQVQLPPGVFVAFAPILAMSLLLPSVGGLGVREEVHRLLYGTVSVANSTAVAMSLSTFGVQTLLPGIVGAVLYALEGAAGLRHTTDQ